MLAAGALPQTPLWQFTVLPDPLAGFQAAALQWERERRKGIRTQEGGKRDVGGKGGVEMKRRGRGRREEYRRGVGKGKGISRNKVLPT